MTFIDIRIIGQSDWQSESGTGHHLQYYDHGLGLGFQRRRWKSRKRSPKVLICEYWIWISVGGPWNFWSRYMCRFQANKTIQMGYIYMRIALDVFLLLINPPSKLRPNFQTSWRGPVIIHFITIVLWRGHLDEAICQGWYTSNHNNLSTFPILNQHWKRIFICQLLLVDNYFLFAACVSGFSWHLRIKVILWDKTSPLLYS